MNANVVHNPLNLKWRTGLNAIAGHLFVFLAAPYSHPDILVMDARYAQACQAAALLMDMGYVVYSPISHGHPICEHSGGRVPRGSEAWRPLNDEILHLADAVAVLDIDGNGLWESRGVAFEVGYAMADGTPLNIITLRDGRLELVEANADPALWAWPEKDGAAS